MSDVLIVGEEPNGNAGKEYFLHCMDWWYQIVWTIEKLVDKSFPFNDVFYSDLFLAPKTPHLTEVQACSLAKQLAMRRESGELAKVLERILRESLEDDCEDEQAILADWMGERMQQVDDFIVFLEDCGGCHAQWCIPEG